MGYRTMHTMDVIGVSEETKLAIIADLRKTCPDAEYSLNEDGSPNAETKWYDHEDHLREFSKKYPDVLIQLSGEGEESRDFWEHHFKNGKAQFCQAIIVIPEFDESKLK